MKDPKPFNLERAQAGDPIMFRNGEPCEFIAYVNKARNGPNLIVLNKEGWICTRERNGYFLNVYDQNPFDVVMAPKVVKHESWVVLFKSGGIEAYDKEATANRIATGFNAECRKIEWEVEE